MTIFEDEKNEQTVHYRQTLFRQSISPKSCSVRGFEVYFERKFKYKNLSNNNYLHIKKFVPLRLRIFFSVLFKILLI